MKTIPLWSFRMTGSQRDLTGRATPRSRSGGSGQRGGRSSGGGGQLQSSKSVDYGRGGDHHGHGGGGHGHRPGSRQAQVGPSYNYHDFKIQLIVRITVHSKYKDSLKIRPKFL